MRETGTRRCIYAVVGLVAATATVVTIAPAFGPRIADAPPSVHPTPALRSGASRNPPPADTDAFSALQPTEMPQGCFSCPLPSYLGTSQDLP